MKSSDASSSAASTVSEAPPSLVAMVGNPNAGKTSLFNALTGSHQKVGNYPGVTVERVSSDLRLAGRVVELVDVPGLYSLNPVSMDETVALEAIEGTNGNPRPDVLVCVIDAPNLDRSLYLYSQVSELGLPVVVAITMSDTLVDGAADFAKLEEVLGAPVVRVVAHKNQGIVELREAVSDALVQRHMPVPVAPGASPALRHDWSAKATSQVIKPSAARRKTTDRIDRILTHRVFGLVVFIGLMYLVFQSIYSLATPLMDGIGWVFERLGDWVTEVVPIPWLQSMLVDGVIGGVGTVITFLPQILILFFFISMLEGSGYLARAAFLMDRLLGWCGLNGRAFIPLLSSFACAIPGIMAARVMPDPRSRLATILVAPLMSCSARLPVYVLLIGAFIEPRFGPAWAGFALFAMHIVGLLVAIPIVWVLNRGVLKGERAPFMLELPRYEWPKWRDVWLAMVLRGKLFITTAGSIIVAMSVVIWALLYFPRSEAQEEMFRAEYAAMSVERRAEMSEDHYLEARNTENSVLGRVGRTIEPVFEPAGFDWRIATSVMAAFPARELMVSSLGILFSLGGDVDEGTRGLHSALEKAEWPDGRALFTPWTTVGLMVFFALCCQCGATLATIRRETNSWKWPTFVFVYMTALAYLAAVGIHQVGRLFGVG